MTYRIILLSTMVGVIALEFLEVFGAVFSVLWLTAIADGIARWGLFAVAAAFVGLFAKAKFLPEHVVAIPKVIEYATGLTFLAAVFLRMAVSWSDFSLPKSASALPHAFFYTAACGFLLLGGARQFERK